MSGRRGSLRTAWLVALVAAGLVAQGCGGEDNGESEAGGGGQTEASAAAGETVKVGANFELSGPGALYGVSKVIGVKAAAEVINEGGGIEVDGQTYEIEVIECDNRTEATYGVQCAQQAADDEVLWTAAPDLGFEGAYEIYKENEILVSGNGGAASTLLNEDLDANPLLTFEYLTYQQSVESNLVQLRALYPDVKRVATLLPNDANGQVQDAAYRELGPEYGFEIVAQELHPTDASGDFSSFLTTLGAADPEVIHLGYYPQVAAAALEQGANLDVADMFTADGLTFEDLEGVSFDGHPLIGYQYGLNWFDGYMPEDPEEQELIARFEELSEGRPYLPSVVHTAFIGVGMMVGQAIEAAGTLDAVEVAAQWPGLEYDGLLGPALGLDNRATDNARTPYVVDGDGSITVYEFPTGLAEEPTGEVEVEDSPFE